MMQCVGSLNFFQKNVKGKDVFRFPIGLPSSPSFSPFPSPQIAKKNFFTKPIGRTQTLFPIHSSPVLSSFSLLPSSSPIFSPPLPPALPLRSSSFSTTTTSSSSPPPPPQPPVQTQGQKIFLLSFLLSIISGGIILFFYLQQEQENKAKRRAKRREEEMEELLQQTFTAFASVESKGGQKLMTETDFLTSLELMFGEDTLTLSQEKIKALLRMAQMDHNGTLDYEQFKLFAHTLNQPDAEYKILFHLFDHSNDGRISKEEFLEVLKAANEQQEIPFNPNSDFVSLFFGTTGTKLLSYTAFTQLLKMLQEERSKQMFMHYDHAGVGYVTEENFLKIMNAYTRKKIPQSLLARFPVVSQLGSRKNFVTYAQFAAVDQILTDINSYERVLKAAERRYPNTPINKDLFMQIARSSTSIEITPMESMIVFALFDLNNDGKISLDDFQKVMERAPAAKDQVSFLTRAKESALNFALGSVAGGIGATAVYPIDLVKTRMQNQRIVPGATVLYKNSWDCFLKVVKGEGVTGLYKGLIPQLVGVAPEKAIKLTVNDLLRNLFENKEQGGISFPLEVLAGGGAGASQVLFTNPLEIVKIRLQVQGENQRLYGTKPVGSVTIVKQLGFFGLYKGASACLLRDIPFSAIYFPTYAKMKLVLSDDEGKVGAKELLLAGAVAGIPAASLVTPADVIKTRLQVEARKGEATYGGISDTFVKIWKAEGWTAFFKGAVARVFRSSPQFGVTLLAYELLHTWVAPHTVSRPLIAEVSSEDMRSFQKKFTPFTDLESRWRLDK